MKLYIETKMGAAGDMLMSAFYGLLEETKQFEFVKTMNRLFPETITIKPTVSEKCGISGFHTSVSIKGCEETEIHSHHEGHHEHHHHEDHHHEHYSYQSILNQIDTMNLPEKVKSDIAAIYRIIGEAEATVHHKSLEQIHFHEVGSLDAIIDVAGSALAIDMLNPECIYASPVHVGNGTVHCAHGILPVPAPATAEILKGIPYYTGQIQSELCTPTGAAILKYYVKDFIDMPAMKVDQIGIGLGTKDFPVANMVRVFSGEICDLHHDLNLDDVIVDISCNIDDMTGEALGFAMEMLLSEGALDVFYIPIQVKKNRPGILLHVFCNPKDQENMIQNVLKYTTTRGVRFQNFNRKKLDASFVNIQIDEQTVIRNKINIRKDIQKQKLEYEDVAAYARKNHLSYMEAYEAIQEIIKSQKSL